MKCKYCNATLEMKSIRDMLVGYCCKEWQIQEDSLRLKVRKSYWYKNKGSK